jgi:exosortase
MFVRSRQFAMSSVKPLPSQPTPSSVPVVGRQKKSKNKSDARPASTTARQAPPPSVAQVESGNWQHSLAVGIACAIVGVWSYWSTLSSLAHTWYTVPDYSHGFLIVPLAILFCVVRYRIHPASYPGVGPSSWLVGVPLLVLAMAMRVAAGRYYFDFLDGWSILPWAAASVALLGGWRLLVWTLPSIGFLWFMVPLPFGWETMASLPLQKIATKLSCYGLQLLGQPAFSEGNVILIGENQLEVAQACSGLRLFMSVIAVAYAYVVLVPRPWWQKSLLAVSVVPIAIISNATRIVVTGLLYQFTTGETAHWFSHEAAGIAMIVQAGLMLGCVHWYLDKLFPEVDELDVSAIVRQSHA